VVFPAPGSAFKPDYVSRHSEHLLYTREGFQIPIFYASKSAES